jgi:peptide/nickel transport system ATP-binding protein
LPTKPEILSSSPTGRSEVVLDIDQLAVHFQLQGGALSRMLGLKSRSVKAVDGVTVSLKRGEVLGLVGESGSGKSTFGRALLGLVPATQGRITYHSEGRGERRVSEMRGAELRQLRTDLQMVFQDPHAALNPSMTIEEAVGHPLVIHKIASGRALRLQVEAALERVGLAPVERFLSKYPTDLSGGQKQRAVIARAIILNPEVLVADEPVSMLDMSVRAKILELMLDLKRDLGLTYLYVTHDLATAKFFCDTIAIMYLGRIVEIGPAEQIYADPKHPYTRSLLAAIPEPDPRRAAPRNLPRGEVPDAARPPLGCSFHPRCPAAFGPCGWEARDLTALLEQRWTGVSEQQYEQERAVVGEPAALDDAGLVAKLPDARAGSGAAATLLEEVRADDPEEPFWKGVSSVDNATDGVRIAFNDPVDPPLLEHGTVKVACHLHDPRFARREA